LTFQEALAMSSRFWEGPWIEGPSSVALSLEDGGGDVVFRIRPMKNE
jgi:hypothetical protein